MHFQPLKEPDMEHGRCTPMVEILYKDQDLFVAVKPAGVLSQDGPAGTDTMPALLRTQEGGEVYPIHRLDREAAGIMVYARTKKAAAVLSDAVQRRRLGKKYLCICKGCPEEREGTYQDLLLHDKTRNKTFVVTRPRGGVKEAVLHYRVLDTREGFSLVEVELVTGRTHQIRVQFSSRRMPLLGDRKYGGGSGELALWSEEVRFPHPVTGKTMTFTRRPQGELWERFLPLPCDTEEEKA